MADQFVTVAKAADVPVGAARVVEVRGQRLALCNVNGTIYVIDDTCTHDDGPLGEGAIDGFAIECPRHGARFDVRTGAVLRMPAAYPIRSYPTRIVNGDVQINLPAGVS
ncbi:MAG: non-heme iron oxygenase ferredoxin subunit [candidate division Zixibacteria bacterium]|nr:non-heme iron oxygenase ferredoxin subunit [candidate division Zixibacteria bacterium]